MSKTVDENAVKISKDLGSSLYCLHSKIVVELRQNVICTWKVVKTLFNHYFAEQFHWILYLTHFITL